MGTGGNVELSNEGADGFVIADAVRWVKNPGGTPDIIVDNGDSGFALSGGGWTCPTGITGSYNNDHCYHPKPAPSADPATELYESLGGRMSYAGSPISGNGVCNACHPAISYERTPYLAPKIVGPKAEPDTVLNDGTGSTTISTYVLESKSPAPPLTVRVNLVPIGGSSSQTMSLVGGRYTTSATVTAGTSDTPKSLVITADDGTHTAQFTITLFVTTPGAIYVDNEEAEFTCTWTYASGVTGAYGNDHRFHAAGTGTCTATWRPNIPSDGTYKVYAWWRAAPNRATDAPYTINYNGGSPTFTVNQEINSSQWNQLGTTTFSFLEGTSGTVVLSNDANENVIADAIKFERQP
jgi:hypothetical protein